ncbi:HEPN domain protein [Desulfofarcimen acetoxidans DSM 771]|uniref:HEPN domain protein n=1 Tax=Desulfofarcimen acetoxidans (strain ATCC 49208 / DSM 771 / KCTC 5769 / VKM B-1644 / 5575) TaxID=485916 RepID=C8VYJ5_DESAS|nr:HEPN domain protein [Desulfofarcimen acetoxidans DSM 771]
MLLERQMYSDAVSRAYYAVFQAARAVLATKSLDSCKHSGIIGLFNQQFVKTGILPRDYGKILKSCRDLREVGDYDDFYLVSREEAFSSIENASRFIRGIKLYLKTYEDDIP